MIPLGVLGSARVSSSGVGTYYDEVTADSPYCYFRMDESSGVPIDTMGTYTMSAMSGTWGAADLGDAATSADFSGSNQSADGAFGTALNTPDYLTLEALIDLDTTSATLDMAAQIVGRMAVDARYARLELGVNSSGEVFARGWTSESASVTAAGGSVSLNTPYHVAATYDGTNLRVYLDGTLIDTQACGALYKSNHQAYLEIGRSRAYNNPGAAGFEFDGQIAGVAVHTAALSTARILAHAQAAGVA